ncbi:MAG TPA: hypothetical protein QGH92_00770 [Candidatus Parcubacteria bacterium]|jgi:hypothetical protein|nr:hypothetical protein [Parcubacteria group bacterium]HJN62122.1 hypothetical protein [Candidatus Parcubacteria bacterium]|tara:strand:- start:375 stop:650 length:276 start_codon:yes stop_codon:yes gene_type:complete
MLILGLGDIIAAGLLMSRVYDIDIPILIIMAFAGYLLLKGLIFIMDIGSLVDIVAGALLILSLYFGIPNIFFFAAAALLAFKGIMTLFARF